MGKDYSSTMDYPLGQRLRELPGPLLLTGHTGFKGIWMTFLLEHLNVPVVGYSLPAEKDSLYDRADRTGAIPEEFSDIRSYDDLERFIDLHKPTTIVHMAAQPLVLKSYENPRETFDVNVMGTANILDIAFKKDFVKAIIVVTTDKVYRNDDSGRAFIESDPLEGKDPYSASKVGTEAVVEAWQQIARASGGPTVVSVRAGNVIGGGDWADDRLFPDVIRARFKNNPVSIRRPRNTRPWQHVLDPLRGYILALEKSFAGGVHPHYNFGPIGESISVAKVVEIAQKYFSLQIEVADDGKLGNKLESTYLSLNSNLAKSNLDWIPVWSQNTAIARSFQWWSRVINEGLGPSQAVQEEIMQYLADLGSTFQEISKKKLTDS